VFGGLRVVKLKAIESVLVDVDRNGVTVFYEGDGSSE